MATGDETMFKAVQSRVDRQKLDDSSTDEPYRIKLTGMSQGQPVPVSVCNCFMPATAWCVDQRHRPLHGRRARQSISMRASRARAVTPTQVRAGS